MKTFDWTLAHSFLLTATEGTLSGAARRLALTQPTLSRQIATLEAELGAVLFVRAGRRLRLTEAGELLLAQVRAMDEAAHAAMLALAGKAHSLSGRVSISVTDVYGAYVMPAIIKQLRRMAPDLTIELIVTNRFSDLLQREADLAVRHQPPTQSNLVGVEIGVSEAQFFTSQQWIAEHPDMVELSQFDFAHFLGMEDAKSTVKHMANLGFQIEESRLRLQCDNFATLWEMAKAGAGVMIMLKEVGMRTPGMVRLWPDRLALKVPMWVVAHREVSTSPRIQLVQSVLVEELRRLLDKA